MKQNRFFILICALITPLFLFTGKGEAAKTIWQNPGDAANKLALYGDGRVRYEVDNDTTKSDNRDRMRIRVRFGAIYNTGAGIETGFRLRTATNSLQSPHHTLSVASTAEETNFGLDRGYIKYSSPVGLWVWAGKNAMPIFYQTTQFWDAYDLQPEGIFGGYKTDLGKNGKIKLTLGHIIINEEGFASDDSGFLYSIHGALNPGNYKIDLAFNGLSLTDQNGAGGKKVSLMAGDATYGEVSLKVKRSWLIVGTEFLFSDVADGKIGTGHETDDKNAFTVYGRVKFNKWFGARLYYYDVGVASVAEFGRFSQDDFPFSSNFTGIRAQLDFKTPLGVNIDVRYYTQDTKNENLTAQIDPATGKTAGFVMTGKGRTRSRAQVNFNVAF